MPHDIYLQLTPADDPMYVGFASARHFVFNPHPFTTGREWLLFLTEALNKATATDATDPYPRLIYTGREQPITMHFFNNLIHLPTDDPTTKPVPAPPRPSGNFWEIHYQDKDGYLFLKRSPGDK